MVFLKRVPRHVLIAIIAWISRAIIAIIQIFSVRILTSSLETNEYALFSLLTGLMGWYMLMDFGLGTSVQNHISEQRAKEKEYETYIIHLLLLLVISFVVLLAFLTTLGGLFANWYLQEYYIDDKVSYFIISGCLFICLALANVVYKIWYGEQKGYLSNIMPAVAWIISFITLICVNKIEYNVNNLLYVLIAFIAPQAFVAIISLLWRASKINFYGLKFKFKVVKDIGNRAIKFWIYSVISAGVLLVDYIILSHFFNTIYSVNVGHTANSNEL